MFAHRLCTRRRALCTGYPQRCKTRRFVRCPAGANVAETSLPGHVRQDCRSHWNPSLGVAADGACPVDNLWTASPATRALRGIVGARWYLFSKRRNSTADVRADGTRHKRRSPCTGGCGHYGGRQLCQLRTWTQSRAHADPRAAVNLRRILRPSSRCWAA